MLILISRIISINRKPKKAKSEERMAEKPIKWQLFEWPMFHIHLDDGIV